MAKSDITLASLPQVDVDKTAFLGTQGAVDDSDGIDLATADRGNEVVEEPQEPAKEPEETTPEHIPEEPAEKTVAEEPEETPEEEEKPEETPDEHVQQQIPYNRFKRELEKRKKLEAELEQLRKNAAESNAQRNENVSVDFNVDVDGEKFKAMSQAFAEGDNDKAQALFSEILGNNVTKAAQAAAQAAIQRADEYARFEAENAVNSRHVVQEAQEAAELVMSEYDVFNDSSDKFNEAMLNEAIRIRDGLIATGASVGEAILEAAELVAARNGIVSNSVLAQQAAKAKTPAAKAPNVKTKLEQAAQTPPRVGGEQHDAKPAINIMDMSVEEFEQLSEADIRRLRGDDI